MPLYILDANVGELKTGDVSPLKKGFNIEALLAKGLIRELSTPPIAEYLRQKVDPEIIKDVLKALTKAKIKTMADFVCADSAVLAQAWGDAVGADMPQAAASEIETMQVDVLQRLTVKPDIDPCCG